MLASCSRTGNRGHAGGASFDLRGERTGILRGRWPPEQVEALQKRLRERGVAIRRVPVVARIPHEHDAPHCDEVTRLAASLTRRAPRIPYISNVTGMRHHRRRGHRSRLLGAAPCQPVRFSAGLNALSSRALLEVGPARP